MLSRAGERLVAHVSRLGVQEHGCNEQLQGFFSGMARFHSRKDRNVDLPDRRWKVSRVPLRLIPLLPAEETRFMLPHVKGVRQYGLVLPPDDLLVNKNTAVPHRSFDFDLTLRRMPDVNCCIGFA